jgi:hypothetical protein
MAVYKRGKIWWYKFNWNGETIRESTKQTNKRTAEQMEAAKRTALAKGEVGIKEKPKSSNTPRHAPTRSHGGSSLFRPHPLIANWRRYGAGYALPMNGRSWTAYPESTCCGENISVSSSSVTSKKHCFWR